MTPIRVFLCCDYAVTMYVFEDESVMVTNIDKRNKIHYNPTIQTIKYPKHNKPQPRRIPHMINSRKVVLIGCGFVGNSAEVLKKMIVERI